jgi:hypothetical protein
MLRQTLILNWNRPEGIISKDYGQKRDNKENRWNNYGFQVNSFKALVIVYNEII